MRTSYVSRPRRCGTLHNLRNAPVGLSDQSVQGVRNVFRSSKLAGPRTIRRLSGRVGWLPLTVHVDGYLLEPGLPRVAFADAVSQRLVSLHEAGQAHDSGYSVRPVVRTQRVRPPPSNRLTRCPCDAIVDVVRLTRHFVAGRSQM